MSRLFKAKARLQRIREQKHAHQRWMEQATTPEAMRSTHRIIIEDLEALEGLLEAEVERRRGPS